MRMAPADRKAMILSRATEFFAEYGLTAQTRALAAACGVAQRLLYRYFPSKAIERGHLSSGWPNFIETIVPQCTFTPGGSSVMIRIPRCRGLHPKARL
jgi:AcrR family transcriptional regulator